MGARWCKRNEFFLNWRYKFKALEKSGHKPRAGT